MMGSRLYPKEPRQKRDLSHRRWHVHYTNMIGEMCELEPWTGYHRTRAVALIAAWWNQNIVTYGGTVTLFDRNGGA